MPGLPFEVRDLLELKYRIQQQEANAKTAEVANQGFVQRANADLIGKQAGAFGATNDAALARSAVDTEGQRIQNLYAPRQAEAGLAGTAALTDARVIENRYLPQVRESEIGLTHAQTANTRASARFTGFQGDEAYNALNESSGSSVNALRHSIDSLIPKPRAPRPPSLFDQLPFRR